MIPDHHANIEDLSTLGIANILEDFNYGDIPYLDMKIHWYVGVYNDGFYLTQRENSSSITRGRAICRWRVKSFKKQPEMKRLTFTSAITDDDIYGGIIVYYSTISKDNKCGILVKKHHAYYIQWANGEESCGYSILGELIESYDVELYQIT